MQTFTLSDSKVFIKVQFTLYFRELWKESNIESKNLAFQVNLVSILINRKLCELSKENKQSPRLQCWSELLRINLRKFTRQTTRV